MSDPQNPESALPEDLSVQTLKGVGPKMSERLARLGISTIADLLFHIPIRYQDRTQITPIGALQPGLHAVVEGESQLSETVYRARPILLCRIADGTGSLTLRFFHFSAAQKNRLTNGVRLHCLGEIRPGPEKFEMIHPEYR